MSTQQRQAQQPGPDPHQLPKSSQQSKGDTSDVGVTKIFQQVIISNVLAAKAPGDEKPSTFDKDREGVDRNGRKDQGRPSQVPDDDVDFQCFRQPTQKEQSG